MHKALDTDYFGRKLALIARDLSHYTPQEVARELVRLAKVADDSEAVKALAMSAAHERSGKLADEIVSLLDEQKAGAKLRDGEWWRGYESALHWIAKAISEKQTETNHAN